MCRIDISPETADIKWASLLEDYDTKVRTQAQERDTPTRAEVEEFFDLLRSMLKFDSTQRLTAEEVLQHPWFSREDVLDG